ncbi:MAG: serine/threonine-protein phosphatase, partial [Candidatus Kapabacteria bacterium]|nr:serine/threonine-protein phosphatase [Candidatus Kapabacteria bacterium]
VGGDFFDVYQHADDHCTIAIGDATGHGLKAGVMVATAKSHFQTHAHDGSHVDILQRTDAGIKRLRLRGMYMCLGLLTIKGHDVWWTAAGIPPVLHYSASNGTVRQMIVKGLPLGSPVHVPIDAQHCRVESGDVLLLMTDGLPELFNKQRETLGMEAIIDTLRLSANATANDIVSHIIDTTDEFRNGEDFHDDVTIVAVTVM